MIRSAILGAVALLLASGGAHAQVQLGGSPGPFRVAVVSYRDLPFRTVVRQHYDFSCGSAALATLLRHHYGRDVDEEAVFRAMYVAGDQDAIRKVGFSLLDMKAYLEAHGYRADGYRVPLDALARRKAPAIVMIDTAGYRHFVVLKAIEGDRVLIGDPALGLKVYDRRTFARLWNGVAFIIHERAESGARDTDWGDWAEPRPAEAMSHASLAELTRELPPIYQVTPIFHLDQVLR